MHLLWVNNFSIKLMFKNGVIMWERARSPWFPPWGRLNTPHLPHLSLPLPPCPGCSLSPSKYKFIISESFQALNLPGRRTQQQPQRAEEAAHGSPKDPPWPHGKDLSDHPASPLTASLIQELGPVAPVHGVRPVTRQSIVLGIQIILIVPSALQL